MSEILFNEPCGGCGEKYASKRCFNCHHETAALDSGTGGQQPVAWLSWIVVATDAPKLVFAHPETEGAFPVYAPTEPKAGVVSEIDMKGLVDRLLRVAGPAEHYDALMNNLMREAAAEIERLTRERDELIHLMSEVDAGNRIADQRAESAEADLARAREALKQIAGVIPWQDSEMGFNDLARSALTAAEGQEDE